MRKFGLKDQGALSGRRYHGAAIRHGRERAFIFSQSISAFLDSGTQKHKEIPTFTLDPNKDSSSK